MNQLIINYPCLWPYKIIGQDEQLLQNAISNAIGEKDCCISFSNKSSSGKYKTLNAEVTVKSEEERLDIFNKLKNDPNVKFVL